MELTIPVLSVRLEKRIQSLLVKNEDTEEKHHLINQKTAKKITKKQINVSVHFSYNRSLA